MLEFGTLVQVDPDRKEFEGNPLLGKWGRVVRPGTNVSRVLFDDGAIYAVSNSLLRDPFNGAASRDQWLTAAALALLARTRRPSPGPHKLEDPEDCLINFLNDANHTWPAKHSPTRAAADNFLRHIMLDAT